jgi:ribosomal protein L30/L7E
VATAVANNTHLHKVKVKVKVKGKGTVNNLGMAKTKGTARTKDTAKIKGMVRIKGTARIRGTARIKGTARVNPDMAKVNRDTETSTDKHMILNAVLNPTIPPLKARTSTRVVLLDNLEIAD